MNPLKHESGLHYCANPDCRALIDCNPYDPQTWHCSEACRKTTPRVRSFTVPRRRQQPIPKNPVGSLEVMRIAGVSARQLQWWAERGYIAPVVHKHRRLYSPCEVVMVVALANLLRSGMSLPKARVLLPRIRRRLKDGHPQQFFIVTDGDKLRTASRKSDVADIAVELRGPIYVAAVEFELKEQ